VSNKERFIYKQNNKKKLKKKKKNRFEWHTGMSSIDK
jgi:hypothetical protein